MLAPSWAGLSWTARSASLLLSFLPRLLLLLLLLRLAHAETGRAVFDPVLFWPLGNSAYFIQFSLSDKIAKFV